MSDFELRICHACNIEHYENCQKCFGFGVFENGTPVDAALAHDALILLDGDKSRLSALVFDRLIVRCPICGSGIFGVPETHL